MSEPKLPSKSALGSKPQSVMACILMASKAAMDGPNFMTPQHVERIGGRPDNAYRQRQLKI